VDRPLLARSGRLPFDTGKKVAKRVGFFSTLSRAGWFWDGTFIYGRTPESAGK